MCFKHRAQRDIADKAILKILTLLLDSKPKNIVQMTHIVAVKFFLPKLECVFGMHLE